jgi:hypothetical protein
VNDRIVVEVNHGSHAAVLDLLLGWDADMTQHRTGELTLSNSAGEAGASGMSTGRRD